MKSRSLYSFFLAILIFAAHLGIDISAECCSENLSMIESAFSNLNTVSDSTQDHSCCKDQKVPKCCDKANLKTATVKFAVVNNTLEFVALVPEAVFRQNYFQHQTFTTVDRPTLPLIRPPSSNLPPYILFSQNLIYA